MKPLALTPPDVPNLAVSGKRTLLVKKHEGATRWSTDGHYLITFDGKDWNTIAVPSGKATNLTAKLPVNFWNEEDVPELADTAPMDTKVKPKARARARTTTSPRLTFAKSDIQVLSSVAWEGGLAGGGIQRLRPLR